MATRRSRRRVIRLHPPALRPAHRAVMRRDRRLLTLEADQGRSHGQGLEAGLRWPVAAQLLRVLEATPILHQVLI